MVAQMKLLSVWAILITAFMDTVTMSPRPKEKLEKSKIERKRMGLPWLYNPWRRLKVHLEDTDARRERA